jgi:CheY-like chemotaxis protein
MLRVVICSEVDLRPLLAATLIGRQGIEVFRAQRFDDVRLLAATLGPQAILVDRDFPKVLAFIERLREEPATRERSLAVLAVGDMQSVELELLEAGANAILRLPPDAGWNERLSRLLQVPVRQQARLLVRIAAATEPESAAAILNLSAGGMLLATPLALHVSDEVSFRFRLPDGTTIAGVGRVAREATNTGYGVEFGSLDEPSREAIGRFLRAARL